MTRNRRRSPVANPATGGIDIPIWASRDIYKCGVAAGMLVLGPRCRTINIYRCIPDAKLILSLLTRDSKRRYDMKELIADGLLPATAYEVVRRVLPSTCRVPTAVLREVARALCCNKILGGLAIVLNLFCGPVSEKDAADLMEAIIGQVLFMLGVEKAKALITELFRPLAMTILTACWERYSTIDLTAGAAPASASMSTTSAPIASSPSAFTFFPERVPTAKSAVSYMRQLHAGTSDSGPTLAAGGGPANNVGVLRRCPTDDTRSSRKRSFSEADLEEEGEVAQALIGGDALAEDEEVETDCRPVKKLRANTSVSITTRRDGRIIVSHVSLVKHICTTFKTTHANPITFDFVYHGPSLDSTIDADVGKSILRTILLTRMYDVWGDSGLSACAATAALDALLSEALISCIANAIGMSDAHTLLRAVGRASQHVPYEQLRQGILRIYSPILSVAVEPVEVLFPAFVDRPLDTVREHLRSVLELRDAGYVYDSGLTPLESLFTTNFDMYSSIFSQAHLQDLGIL
ncbi:hypothetical protein EV714DRAFT_240064 [Schizophyllum commune]